jgi:hypothetical protein
MYSIFSMCKCLQGRPVGHPFVVLAGSRPAMMGQSYEHPVVDPHVSHFKQVPFRTSVKFKHSEHISPS